MTAFVSVRRCFASPRSVLVFSHDSQFMRYSWRNARMMSTFGGEFETLVQDENENRVVEATMMAAEGFAVRELQRQLEKEKARSAHFEELAKDREKDLAVSNRILSEKANVMYEGSDMVSFWEMETVKVTASFAIFKSEHGPETNIRPVIEARVREWYECKNRSKKRFDSEDALEAFVGLLSSNDPVDDENRLRLTQAIDKAAILGQIDDVDKHRIVCELKDFFDNVHETVPDMDFCRLRQYTRPGFVYADEKFVAAAASAFLIYFNYSHTVMSKHYNDVRYSFDANEGEI